MLLETIDDLLALAEPSPGSPLGRPDGAGGLPGPAPLLILLVGAGGELILVDECCQPVETEIRAAFQRALAAQLRQHPLCRVERQFSGQTLTGYGVRLSNDLSTPLLGCLYREQPRCEQTDSDWQLEVACKVSHGLARALFRSQQREAELRARTEQLMATAESLQVSHARSLAEAIEEHEERLREREASEWELKRLHACNQLILDSAGEGIVGLNSAGRITFVNPAAERLVGWSAEQLVGQSFHELIHHSKANQTPRSWGECPVRITLEDGTTQHGQNDVFWRQDGSEFPVEYVATPMCEANTIVGAVLTFQDISKRRVLEGQLLQAQKLESIGQLAAGIAHEINTPTQFIGDNLRFLKDAFADLQPVLAAQRSANQPADFGDCAGDSVQGLSSSASDVDLDFLIREIPLAISQSLEGVGRVATIVRSMKEFSHPGSDEMQAVDLNKALLSTLTVCRNEWKYVADVVTDFDPHLPLVHCLPGACNQVFLNLIINAAHAIAEKPGQDASSPGRITISTRSNDEWVEVRISDTGAGIRDDICGKVFDHFFTTKEVGRGTGQGLSIARSVVAEQHGGTLTFETQVGQGTTFIVRLPRNPHKSPSKRDIP